MVDTQLWPCGHQDALLWLCFFSVSSLMNTVQAQDVLRHLNLPPATLGQPIHKTLVKNKVRIDGIIWFGGEIGRRRWMSDRFIMKLFLVACFRWCKKKFFSLLFHFHGLWIVLGEMGDIWIVYLHLHFILLSANTTLMWNITNQCCIVIVIFIYILFSVITGVAPMMAKSLKAFKKQLGRRWLITESTLVHAWTLKITTLSVHN